MMGGCSELFCQFFLSDSASDTNLTTYFCPNNTPFVLRVQQIRLEHREPADSAPGQPFSEDSAAPKEITFLIVEI